MTPDTCLDDESLENDVRYGIDDCRRRLRSQRATLRTQHHSPIDVSNGTNSAEAPTESYAEILANISLSQGSLSKLVECLLGPSDSQRVESAAEAEREKAALT
jgi:hypothetical protein